MRIGLIGVGRIGAFHAQTLTDLTAVDELIITDAIPDLAERLGQRLHASVAPEPTDLLAAGVDGVDQPGRRVGDDLLDLVGRHSPGHDADDMALMPADQIRKSLGLSLPDAPDKIGFLCCIPENR